MTNFAYDAAGRLTRVFDPLGNSTLLSYDDLNDLTQITDALGAITRFAYDGDRNLLSVTDANGGSTNYNYDNMDRRTSRTDPLGHTESPQYDGNGNLTQFTDRRGKVTVYQYDGLDRRTFAGFGKTANGYDSQISYTWDGGDRMTQAVDSIAGTISRSYDGLDDLLSEATPPGSINYQYDLAQRRTSMTVAGQPTVSYAWDNADRLTGITQSGTLSATSVGFTYDNANRRTSLTLPNGILASYAYDADSRVTAMSWMAGTSQVGDLEYLYDDDGRVLQRTGSFATIALPAAVSGNRFNAANEMTAFNGAALTYDQNGNLSNDGSNTYAWDARNHLSMLMGVTLPTSASFVYDAFGRRASKTINSQTTNFIYDGFNPVQELAPSGLGQFAPTANTLTGLGIDEFLQRTDANGAESFITDMLDSTLALTNSLGSILTSYTYEPFGRLANPSPTDRNPHQFTGRENDGTGLYFYRARYYNPTLQRFLSQDPLDYVAGDTNLYAFVSDDPLSLADPLGLTSLVFDPARGILTVDPEQPGRARYNIPAISGRHNCHCSSSTPNKGPIPSGDYHLNTTEISQPTFLWNLFVRNNRLIGGADWGGWRVPLHPNRGTRTFDRKGFFLHEGYPGFGSAGCINVGGGLLGNTQTNQLLQDLRSDPDGVVPVHVK